MTLNDLYSKVTGKRQTPAPRIIELYKSGSPIIAQGSHDTGSATVFENGYILYTEDDRWTIFHISDVYSQGIEYETDREDIVPKRMRMFSAVYFHDQDWMLSVVMEGNKRLFMNSEKRNNKMVEFRYSTISEELEQLGFIPEYLLDEDEIEFRARIRTRINEVKSLIVPSQWNVYVSITAYGATEEDLARKLNISQQAVSKRYKKALKNIPKARTVSFPKKKQ